MSAEPLKESDFVLPEKGNCFPEPSGPYVCKRPLRFVGLLRYERAPDWWLKRCFVTFGQVRVLVEDWETDLPLAFASLDSSQL